MPIEYRPNSEDDAFLDLQDPSAQELETQVQRAKAELDDLKRKQEQIEREKARLEELSRKQEELEEGRTEMSDKLARAMVLVQREADETLKRLEQLRAVNDSFSEHLRALEEINPKLWSGSEMPKELSKALTAVEAARAEFSRAQAKIAVESAENSPTSQILEEEEYAASQVDRSFGEWVKIGLAVTLPLWLLGIIFLLVWLWAISTQPVG